MVSYGIIYMACHTVRFHIEKTHVNPLGFKNNCFLNAFERAINKGLPKDLVLLFERV